MLKPRRFRCWCGDCPFFEPRDTAKHELNARCTLLDTDLDFYDWYLHACGHIEGIDEEADEAQ